MPTKAAKRAAARAASRTRSRCASRRRRASRGWPAAVDELHDLAGQALGRDAQLEDRARPRSAGRRAARSRACPSRRRDGSGRAGGRSPARAARACRRSSRGGAVRPKNRPCSTDADGLGSWLAQSSSICPSSGPRRGTSDEPAADGPGDRRAEGEREQQRREARSRSRAARCRAPASRPACPARAPGRAAHASSVVLAPSEVPPSTAFSSSRWSISAEHLVAEDRHRVVPHLRRAGRSRRGRAGRCRSRGSRAPPASAASGPCILRENSSPGEQDHGPVARSRTRRRRA